ncbi:MAG: malto-oligosyltrehalose synthase, partial [Candidatus Dormibacteria bacterium]
PYLAKLGISHLYCSPYMQAAPGSAHGYDVVDPTRVNDELGGDPALQRLDETLAAHHMGQLLDVVPNHMCVDHPANRWWWHVLQRGRDSEFAAFFDIDWDAPGVEGKVVLPVLGDEPEAVLARGEVCLATDGAGEPVLRYFEHSFPVAADVRQTDDVRQLLSLQHYVLDFWKTGLRRLNYRRFFDVSTLAAVRADVQRVHETTHHRALELMREGVVDGLRIDHVDGLHDPQAYVERLRAQTPDDAWIVVEKILGTHESLPDAWPVDGTTGYDFAALLTRLMVDGEHEDHMSRVYREFTGDAGDFASHACQARLQVLAQLLSADLDRLTRVATAAGIADARDELGALLAAMPVYRVYPRDGTPLDEAGARIVDAAVASASASGACDERRLQSIRAVVLGEEASSSAQAELRVRMQQLGAATTAKGIEDTAFYRYVRLVALNEVGGDPSAFGIDANAFHAACSSAASRHRQSLLATATHDTKRGEDARVRIAMLTEMPDAWAHAVARWRDIGRRHRGAMAPSPVAEYLFFQTMIGVHPIDAERASAYMRKAVREAKQETSWLAPDERYEKELDSYVRGMLADDEFVTSLSAFLAKITPAWYVAALSQTLLKLMCPGVADIYQGCELWDLSVVDPDNRRPVDYALRRELLHELDAATTREVWTRAEEGLPKLHVVRSALQLRRRRPEAFAPGARYRPLVPTGLREMHAVACARAPVNGDDEVIAVAVRLAHAVSGGWHDTSIDLPAGTWRNVLSDEHVKGGAVRLADLLDAFPVALLERST